MLFAALTNSVCLNNASLFFFFFFLNIFYDRAMSSPEKQHLKITIITIIINNGVNIEQGKTNRLKALCMMQINT